MLYAFTSFPNLISFMFFKFIDNFDLHLVSLPDRTQTPDLCTSRGCHSFEDGLVGNQQLSLDEVELQHNNSRATFNKKRKKMRNSLNKPAKKFKPSDFPQNGSCKAAGGGHQTNQTCTARNGRSAATSAPTKTGLAGAGFANQGCLGGGGGGGGDGGEDGDGPGENKKMIVHDSPRKAAIPKKKKSSSDEMEIDSDLPSSSDSPMDVDTRSSEKQSSDCDVSEYMLLSINCAGR